MTVAKAISDAMNVIAMITSDEEIPMPYRQQALDSFKALNSCQEALAYIGTIPLSG